MYDSTNVSDVDRFVCLCAGGGGGVGTGASKVRLQSPLSLTQKNVLLERKKIYCITDFINGLKQQQK